MFTHFLHLDDISWQSRGLDQSIWSGARRIMTLGREARSNSCLLLCGMWWLMSGDPGSAPDLFQHTQQPYYAATYSLRAGETPELLNDAL